MLFQALAQTGRGVNRDEILNRRDVGGWRLRRVGEDLLQDEGPAPDGLRANAVRGGGQYRRLG